MTDAILVINAGSSSIKFSVFPDHVWPTRQDLVCTGEFEGIGSQLHFTVKDATGAILADDFPRGVTHEDALIVLRLWLDARFPDQRVVGAGHRVVHGGVRYAEPVRIDGDVLADLERLIPLAPLHQPHHIAAIRALSKLHPSLVQVACFDTAFHHTQAAVETTFALPRRLSAEGIRRYGFHGLSYEYIAGVLPQYLGAQAAGGRVVVAHLGSGASMCAMHGRKSVATTMGFTALDGLPMSRRCGSLDPGVVLYLMQEKRMSADDISTLLYHDCGLIGVSGVSDDMRVLLASDRPSAREAIDLFVYRITRELGSLAATLGGLDALVFTAGIGEHAGEIRQRVCEAASWLGLDADPQGNATGGPCITRAGSRVSAWVIPTDEELMIARHVWSVLGRQSVGDTMQVLPT